MSEAATRPGGGQVTMGLLKDISLAFNSRDVDRIMSFFAEDATFYMASGPEPVGRTVHGKAADGTALNYKGCDLYEFWDGLIHKKDTYWKIVRPD